MNLLLKSRPRIFSIVLVLTSLFFNNRLFADVTLTSTTIAAANIAQGSNNNIVYAVKMDVTLLPVTVSNIQFTIGGTYDNNDLPTVSVFFNPTAPTVSGAGYINSGSALFTAPHIFSFPVVQTISAGGSGYFIILVNVDAAATSGNTVKLDGAANPVVFGFTTSPTVTNNQTNTAGTQTILAAAATLTSTTIAAANIAQGSNNNIVYAVKMDVTLLPVTVSNIQFTIGGTYDNNDLPTVSVFFNPTTPTLSGAGYINSGSALFTAPHTFSFPVVQTISAGGSGYFIILVNVDVAATGGNTVKVDGAASPVVFGFTTSPAVTNNQTNTAGTQTILAAAATLTSTTIAAANIAQGSTNNMVYAVKMDVTLLPVTTSSIQFNLDGTYDNNDLPTVSVYFNATTPTVSGASYLNSGSALFTAPHTFSFPVTQTISAGGSGYFIILVSIDAAATGGNTVKVDGAASPVVFGFTTSPTVTNNQTNTAGIQTILASGVTLTSSTIAAATMALGSTNNIVYAVRMDVTSLPVTTSGIQFNLGGTYDNNDLPTVSVYFNPATPTVSGASYLNSGSALFTAPHIFSFPVTQTISAGGSGYFIILVSVDAAATAGNTVKLDGAANPVVFTYTTSPPVTNNQTNIAGTQTILSTLPLTLISFSGNIINTQQTLLQWTTAGELNTKDFEIEWSTDGLLFTKIALLQKTGNSLQNKQYTFIHKTPDDGNNFYRLKINDQNGRFTYSPVIKIKIAVTATKVTVLQNPVNDILQLQIQAQKNESLIFSLYSADGKIIASKQFAIIKGNNRLSWEMKQLATGNYFIVPSNHLFETVRVSKN